jgi:hypothetical protein
MTRFYEGYTRQAETVRVHGFGPPVWFGLIKSPLSDHNSAYMDENGSK